MGRSGFMLWRRRQEKNGDDSVGGNETNMKTSQSERKRIPSGKRKKRVNRNQKKTYNGDELRIGGIFELE
jgi:hypothetical protein